MQYLIDAHHHFWQLPGSIAYPWLEGSYREDFFLGDYRAICRTFLDADLRALVPEGYQLLASVHCEAECVRDQAMEEARWIAQWQAMGSVVRAQMAWVDLFADDVAAKLSEMAAIPGVRGVRCKPASAVNATQSADVPVCGSLRDPRLARGLQALAEANLLWDLRLPSWHLQEAAALLGDFPTLRVVVNHCGLPWDRSPAGIGQWQKGMEALAALPDCWLKLSELGCPGRSFHRPDNQVLLDTALAIFGPSRAMYASNAPVSGVQVSYGDWLAMVESAIVRNGHAGRQDVLWRNAARCFHFDDLLSKEN